MKEFTGVWSERHIRYTRIGIATQCITVETLRLLWNLSTTE